MSVYNSYKNRVNCNGVNTKARLISDVVDNINDDFDGHIEKQDVYINYSVNTESVIITSKESSDIILNSKNITMKPNVVLNVGDLVKWNDEFWICVKIAFNEIYYTGIIYKCNNELNWLDEFGVIQNTPCFLSDKSLYSIGTQEELGLIIPDGKFNMIISKTVNTSKIKRDDRFILNHKYSYKVSKFDNISSDGIILLTLQEELKNCISDNLELNIANYYNDNNYEIFVDNGNVISIAIDDTHQISATIKNNGIELYYQPTLGYSSSDTDIATVNSTGLITGVADGNVNITVVFNDLTYIINTTITDVISDNYKIVINGSDYIRKGEIIEFATSVTNNGVEEIQPVTFENIDTSLVQVIETTDSSIKLKGLKSEGSFVFVAKLDIDDNISVTKTVGLKYLF